MEKEEIRVDSVRLLADIQECCKKHGMKIVCLNFKDELDNKDDNRPPFQLVKIEIYGGYKTPKENLILNDGKV